MSRSPFDPPFEALPAELPIFPLTGALLLPGGRLPLNIFEPRYLAMVSDALAAHRLLGMIQPRAEPEGLGEPPVFHTGCAGRITAFQETEDGRFQITLTGLIRFDVSKELEGRGGYRLVRPDFHAYQRDLAEASEEIDREGLLMALRHYFESTGMKADWASIEQASDERLVNTLSMICPFGPAEKQALLEAGSLVERAHDLTAILEMAAADSEHEDGGSDRKH